VPWKYGCRICGANPAGRNEFGGGIEQRPKRVPELSYLVSLRTFICLALCTIVPLGGAVAQAPPADTQAIASAIRERNFDQAVALARTAIQRSPNDPKLWALQGIALSSSGHSKEALSAYNNALKISPDYLPALEGAAELEYNAGSSRAAPLLEHILKLQPANATAHAMLGVVDYKQHACESAIKHFEAAKDVIDKQPAALTEFGTCLVGLERAEDALPVFQRLLELQPNDAHARYNLAVVQLTAHHAQDAVDTLQPLLKNAQPDSDVLDVASSAYEAVGDTPSAVRLLRQAIVQDPKKPKYYVDFTSLCFAHGSFQVGIDMLDLGLKQNPNDAGLYVARGVLYIQLGKYEQAEADFESANKIDPRQSSGAVAEGLAQIQQSKPEQALATVRAHLKQHPEDAFLHYLEAQALFQQGAEPATPQFRQAVAAAERAVQLRPNLVLAHDLLGNLYLKSGDIQKSILQSRRALQESRTDQESLYHLIQALRKSNPKDAELPALVKRLAELRQQSRNEEAEGNRYRLYEAPSKDAPK
jgi:tetratricopeptide (TPR) repeat protein